jgi:hypothetical protein
LPPVFPLVLYNGERKWSAPQDMAQLVAKAPGTLSRYRPSMRYMLIEVRDLEESRLRAARNYVAQIFHIERSDNFGEAYVLASVLMSWFSKGGPQQESLKRAVHIWLQRVQKPGKIQIDDALLGAPIEELEPMLRESLKRQADELIARGRLQGREEGIDLGLQKGREEGREEGVLVGEAEVLRRQCERKFGALTSSLVDQIGSADREMLEKWLDRILTAKSPDELFS